MSARWAVLPPARLEQGSASASKALTPRPSHTSRTLTCWVRYAAAAPASSTAAVPAAARTYPVATARVRKCPRKSPGSGPRSGVRPGSVTSLVCWMATRLPDSARRNARVSGAGARGPPGLGEGRARAGVVLRLTPARCGWRWARVCRCGVALGRMPLRERTLVTLARERTQLIPACGPTRLTVMLERTLVMPPACEPKLATLPRERTSLMPACGPTRLMLALGRALTRMAPGLALMRRRHVLERAGAWAPRRLLPWSVCSLGPVGCLRQWARRWRPPRGEAAL